MPYLYGRNPLADAKDTFSSWDKCMAKTYCKWPVIVAIVVASLIILSIVFCVARCICCGAELACCCFKCCTCCCPSGRGKSGHKRMNSAPPPPIYPPSYPTPAAAPSSVDNRPLNQQYRSHAAPAFAPAPVPAYREPEQPQYARFESTKPKPGNEDALPAMPTMSDAREYHVEETVMPEKHDDVELDRLDHNGSVTNSAVTSAAAVPGPRRSPIQRSPTGDSYGFPPGYQNGQAGAGPPRRSPHSTPSPYGGQYGQHQDDYRGVSPVQNLSPVYGAGAGGGYSQNQGQNQPYGRRSPNAPNPPNPGFGQQYGRPNNGSPAPYAGQRNNDYGYSNNPRDVVEMPSPVQHENNGYGYHGNPRDAVEMPSPVQHQQNNNYNNYSNNNHHDAVELPSPIHPHHPTPPRGPPARSPSPDYSPSGYAPSGSTRFEAPAAYPGQQSYQPASAEPAYPGQQAYRAFSPAQDQYSGVTRKPVDGSWKEV